MSDASESYHSGDRRSNVASAILIGAIVALVAANVYLYLRIDGLRSELSKQRETLSTEIAGLKETASLSGDAQRQRLEALQNELGSARQQAVMAANQAKREALSRADQMARRLSDEQQQQHQQVASQLNEVKEAATSANTKLDSVTSDVSTVRSEVASTKSELDRTIADLKRVTGDLGVTSGLVATNSQELAALRRLGERDYVEFTLGKTKQPQRVGHIMLKLKKADAKRNRYTVDLWADDKRIEKKDRTINEPVQFYIANARQPYEIVINQVGKDRIVGYLAAPKEQVKRASN